VTVSFGVGIIATVSEVKTEADGVAVVNILVKD
jgi:hypothetical protein